MDISELIERLEKATGPDVILDSEIAVLCRLEHWQRPCYTASIDAALTLVPPWSWRVGNLPSGKGFADLGTQKSLQCVEGATPAIAICIAVLKARAAALTPKQ